MRARTRKTLEIQDILRVTAREAAEILERMDGQAARYHGRERRQAARVSCHDMPRVAVLVENEEIGNRTYLLIPRNISCAGMSLLHGKFVYDGTPCVVGLKTLDGQVVPVRGKIMHCRLITGRVHELGIRFDEPIELGEFASGDQGA
ncbi:MAG: PilZ domain-containing protein [Planctomycetota bacterium]